MSWKALLVSLLFIIVVVMVIGIVIIMQALKAGDTGDEDIIRLAAEDAELARAKERLTLKHRNSSKWARRALKRGMDVMDEGTKAAVAEQLRLGEELRRKVLQLSCVDASGF